MATRRKAVLSEDERASYLDLIAQARADGIKITDEDEAALMDLPCEGYTFPLWLCPSCGHVAFGTNIFLVFPRSRSEDDDEEMCSACRGEAASSGYIG